MSILCRRCGREYDVTLFSFGGTVRCDCGATVRLEEGHVRPLDEETERQGRMEMEALARGADRIVDMILRRDVAPVDIAIAIERLRDRAEELFPGSEDHFRRVYEARFDRLMEQWPEGV